MVLAFKPSVQEIENQNLKLVKSLTAEDVLVAELRDGSALALQKLYKMYSYNQTFASSTD